MESCGPGVPAPFCEAGLPGLPLLLPLELPVAGGPGVVGVPLGIRPAPGAVPAGGGYQGTPAA
jgi:hypothetical protein